MYFLPIGLLVKGTSLADGGDYTDFGGAVMVGLVYRRPVGRPPGDRPTV